MQCNIMYECIKDVAIIADVSMFVMMYNVLYMFHHMTVQGIDASYQNQIYSITMVKLAVETPHLIPSLSIPPASTNFRLDNELGFVCFQGNLNCIVIKKRYQNGRNFQPVKILSFLPSHSQSSHSSG